MRNNRMKGVLETITCRDVPEETNLWPTIAARLAKRKLPMKTLQLRLVYSVLLALLVLLALTGVAYAIGTMLGYIPGLGIVEQDPSLRILEDPVHETRDGITITVQNALISSDITTLLLTAENVPFDKLSPVDDRQCSQWPELRLSDGSSMQITEGERSSDELGVIEWRLKYAPIAAGFTDVTLLIPCLQNAAPGVLPENWEFSLRFIPASSELTIMPVMEISPSTSPASDSGVSSQNPLSIISVIDTGDGYILIGEFDPPAPSETVDDWYATGSVMVRDADQQEIVYDIPQDIEWPAPESSKASVWAAAFKKGFAPPLTITYSSLYTVHVPSQEKIEIEFDAGSNPQEGQSWQLDQEIQLAGRTFTLVSIRASQMNFYEFHFTSDDNRINSVGIDIPGYTPNGGGQDTCGCILPAPIEWSESVGFRELPTGKLRVILSDLWIYGDINDWTLEWQP